MIEVSFLILGKVESELFLCLISEWSYMSWIDSNFFVFFIESLEKILEMVLLDTFPFFLPYFIMIEE